MTKLILLRHLKSQWNEENRFTGWVDVPLAKNNYQELALISKKVLNEKTDVVYTSPLFRNMETVAKLFEYSKLEKYPLFIHLDEGKMKEWGKFTAINKNYIPVYVSQKLNERYYGKLQGLNKEEIIKKYGEEKVRLWRRSYEIAPPGGESGRAVYARVVPFFKKHIERDLKKMKKVLVVASHNSLRVIIKYLEKISDKDILNLELGFNAWVEYSFDGKIYKKMV